MDHIRAKALSDSCAKDTPEDCPGQGDEKRRFVCRGGRQPDRADRENGILVIDIWLRRGKSRQGAACGLKLPGAGNSRIFVGRMKIKKNLKWALVLAGGGSRGIAHVGVLNALQEMGFPEPSLVAGTSMGAIVGGLYACGMSPGAMKQFFISEFDIARYLDSFAFKISGILGKVFQTGQILGNAITRTGIDSGHLVLNLLEKLSGGKTFAETRIPFRCNAVDLVSGKEVVFSSGSVARAIRASMAFPGVFEPLMEGGRCLVDGGLVDNMPVRIAREEGFRRLLALP